MSVITNEERAVLLEEMADLLKEYDYEYTEDALNKIIDEWAFKKTILIEAFKTHPNYIDGKFMIAFDQQFIREMDKNQISAFHNWHNSIVSNTRYLNKEINERRIREGCEFLPNNIFKMTFYATSWMYSRLVTEEDAEEFNRYIPELHVHVGEKTSRVMNRLMKLIGWDKHPDYNREFAKYADALNPLTVNRTIVISLHPIDYLTMSFGNSWSSCHTIDKANKRNMLNGYHGQYSSGTMSYMLDGASIVCYTVDPKITEQYYTAPKITRQMFHYGQEKLVQGRLYPQSNDGNKDEYAPYRNVMQDVIAKIFGFPNLWTTSTDGDKMWKYTYSQGTHYRDYTRYKGCSLSRKKDSENEIAVTIGAEPICVNCGERHMFQSTINHCSLKGSVCTTCGHEIDREEDDYYTIDGHIYCADCVNYCEDCDEYYLPSQGIYHDEYGFICRGCLEAHFIHCEECDEIVYKPDVKTTTDNKKICPHCARTKYILCHSCGKYHKSSEVERINSRYICKKCKEENDGQTVSTETLFYF